MSNNDFLTVTYKMLSYLKWCYENGKMSDPDILNFDTFNVSMEQFGNILGTLKERGYVDGVSVKKTLNGTPVITIGNASITIEGLEYLAKNSKMKELYKELKEVRDWLPGF